MGIQGVTIPKEKLYEALRVSRGNIAEAARRLDVWRGTVDKRVREDPELKELVEQGREIMVDLSENVMYETMDKGENPALRLDAAKYVLKNLGHKRGYSAQDTNVYTSGGQVVINRVVEASDKPPESHGKS